MCCFHCWSYHIQRRLVLLRIQKEVASIQIMKPRSSKKQRVTRQADASTPTLASAESIARRHRAEARQKARDSLVSVSMGK